MIEQALRGRRLGVFLELILPIKIIQRTRPISRITDFIRRLLVTVDTRPRMLLGLASAAFIALHAFEMLFHRLLNTTLGPYLLQWQMFKYVLLIFHDALRPSPNQILVITILPTLITAIIATIQLQRHNFLLLAALISLILAAAFAVFPTLLTISHTIIYTLLFLFVIIQDCCIVYVF